MPLWERLCCQYAGAHHAYPSYRLPYRQSLGLAAIRTFSRQYFRGVLDSDVHWADVGVFRVFGDSENPGPVITDIECAECMGSPYIRPTDTTASSLETLLCCE